MSRTLLFFLFGVTSFLAQSNAVGAAALQGTVEDFRLLDHQGKSHELYRYSDAKAIVLITQGNGCPIIQGYIPTIHGLENKFKSRGVLFLMINANAQDSREAVVREALADEIDIPILMDDSQIITAALGMKRTGEALVIDPNGWKVVYRGAIDDRIGYGGRKPEARHRYLEEALDVFLSGGMPRSPGPEAPGCLFNLEDGPAPTYAKAAGPILRAKCAGCHGEGKGPPEFGSYEQARGWAPMIRETIRTKRMPPWFADPEYGHFANDISLSKDEARTLVRWVEGGAQRGEGADPLLGRREPERQTEKPDMVLGLDHDLVIPATGTFTYHNFQLSSRTAEDLWIRGIEMRTNPRVTHHFMLYISSRPLTELNPAEIEFHELNDILRGWTPGRDSVEMLPEGYARLVPRGSYFLVTVHHTPCGRVERDRPAVGLYLYKDKTRPRKVEEILIQNPYFRIPPGVKDYELKAETLFKKPIEVLALVVHMHARGVWMRISARYPDGGRKTLLSVPAYQFKAQRKYELAEPARLPAGTKVVMEGAFDNSAQNPDNPDPTRWAAEGPQATDEMFLSILSYAADDRPR